MCYDTGEGDEWQWIKEWRRVLSLRGPNLIDCLILDGSAIDELSNRALITEGERDDLLGRKIREENNQIYLSLRSPDERKEFLNSRIRRENNQHFLDIVSQKSHDYIRQIIEIFRIRKKTAIVNCLERLLDECFECIRNSLRC